MPRWHSSWKAFVLRRKCKLPRPYWPCRSFEKCIPSYNRQSEAGRLNQSDGVSIFPWIIQLLPMFRVLSQPHSRMIPQEAPKRRTYMIAALSKSKNRAVEHYNIMPTNVLVLALPRTGWYATINTDKYDTQAVCEVLRKQADETVQLIILCSRILTEPKRNMVTTYEIVLKKFEHYLSSDSICRKVGPPSERARNHCDIS